MHVAYFLCFSDLHFGFSVSVASFADLAVVDYHEIGLKIKQNPASIIRRTVLLDHDLKIPEVIRGNDTLAVHGMLFAFYVSQFPRPGVFPKLPLKPYQHTLGDIVLGTPQIKEDCESDGVELDSYLPVS